MDERDKFEYAIRKDVRNNPIVREVDADRQRELWHWVAIACAFAIVLLANAWQHLEIIRHGYRLEQMQRERATEDVINRHLKLEIETLRAPKRIEELAVARLGMVQPTSDNTLVFERRVQPEAASQLVASR